MTKEDMIRAEKIIDTWFWQIDETRAYGYRGALNTITRFYESAPMSADIMKIVLEYLNSQEKMTSVSLNNKLVSLDGEWKAVAAFYRTAQGQNWAGTESSKVRVYQMIAKMGDEEGDGPYTVEDGCKYKVTHKFYWNTAEEPTLPKSSSGVQYQIGGLTRDRETGLFSYVIECRETVQQDVKFYDTAVTIFETVEEALHLGVKAEKVESTGEMASAANGVLVERRVTKNPDCTSDIQNRRTTEDSVIGAVTTKRKTVKGTVTSVLDRNQAQAVTDGEPEKGETFRSETTPGGLHNNTVETFTHDEGEKTLVEQCQKTVFEHTDEALKSKAALDEGETVEVADAAGGVIKSKTVRETEEGVEISERTTTEKGVASAVVVKRGTVRGTVTSTTDRNQVTALDGTPKKGETFRSETTPGGLHNNTTETFTHDEGEKTLVEQDTKTIFERTEETLTGKAALDEGDKAEVADAANGVISSKTVRETEEGFDVSKRTVTEKAVTSAVVVKRGTLRGTITSTTDRNQVSALTAAPKVGETLRSEKTPGGLHNNTTETVTPAQSGNVRKECRTSKLTHTDISVDIVPEGTVVTEGTAAVNQETQEAIIRNEDGTTDKQTVTTTYTPESKVKTWSDDNYDYTHCSYVNQPEPLMPASGEVRSASFAPNDHGSYNGSYTTRTGKKSTTATETLQWSKSSSVQSKYYYFNRKGDYCARTFTADVYYCYGRTNAVIDAIADGENCAHVGWRSTWNGNHEYAQGVKYSNVQSGGEEVLEAASDSSGE